MICAIVLCLLTTSTAVADGAADYRAALQAADLEAQSEQDKLGRIDIGLGSEFDGRSGEVHFYDNNGAIENSFAQLVAIHDDAANICMWGYQTDIMPSLPRTAALAVKAQAEGNGWPSQSHTPWDSTTAECTHRTNLATLIGDVDYIGRLAVGPHIVYLGITMTAAGS